MPAGWEQARLHRALGYFDDLSQSFDPLVGSFNSNYPDDMERIHRIDPRPILTPGELRADGRMRLFQCRTAFLKVLFEGAGTILIGWGYWVPGTGDVVFPEVNRLVPDPSDGWQLYRYHADLGLRDHREYANTVPYHLARSLVERLAQISATPPELATSLAL